MSILISEMPHRPNVLLVNPTPIMDINRGKKQLQFTLWVQEKITMTISFPKDGGVRVRNDNAGMFEPTELCEILYEQINETTLKMTGNGTTVVLTSVPEKWEISVYDRHGIKKTSLCGDALAYQMPGFKVGINIDEKPSLYRVFLPIEEGEEFYGFGERLNSLKQNKSELLMWNTDILVTDANYSALCFDNCDKTQSYKNIPLIHSTNNYSVFFNSYLPISFDIGKHYPEYIKADIYGTQFDLYIWTDTAADNLVNYHKLTGTPFIPPKWAFDYWLGGGWPIWNTPDSSHAYDNIRKVLDTYESYGIKVEQAYLETDPTEKILGSLRDRGVRTFMWTNSCLPAFGKSKLNYDDYRVKKASCPDEVMRYNYIDFTSASSKEVIRDKFESLWKLGVCGEMVDFADSMPEDSLCSNGKNGTEMHNEYAYWYGRRMNEAFSERLDKEFVLFQRSGCAGSHHYTTSFGGDSYSNFLGLKRSVWQMLSASASGISIWGSDIGGFTIKSWMPQDGPEFEELYMRWVQFGTFSPLMRDHSWHGKHHPWANGENGLRNFQCYYAIRLQLLDQIYSAALKSGNNGGTMVESMAIAYGASPSLDTQYMFCEDLLVRPILELGQREAEVLVPEDGFYDYYSGIRYDAGKQKVEAPKDRIPVLVRPGSVIAYRQYQKDIVSTLEKDKYDEAIMVTIPTCERTSMLYSEEGLLKFTNCFKEGIYQISADKGCTRHTVIVLGAKITEVSSDVEVVNIEFDEIMNRTIISLGENWKKIYYKI